MKSGDIVITSFDRERLVNLIGKYRAERSMMPNIKKLEDEIARAKIVSMYDVPADIVTLNSRVKFRIVSSGEERTYKLVFPHEADVDNGKLSILSPIGTSLIGFSAGNVVEWEVPGGKIKIEILEVVYQPESAGHYNL
ncbi:MAG TPA: nucleoside diphosphate kinase regulator [Spirochaetota bacterium]|nr:nucleoside diphosphate kinase regulator [Spirochaetota bacterium]HQO03876.1 nucleoside diphosphate kinase regulator [Spirochaetota bacterium]HQP50357.1 nucleoside diphosphate kinase regulator [Spirochaetota bacterium]